MSRPSDLSDSDSLDAIDQDVFLQMLMLGFSDSQALRVARWFATTQISAPPSNQGNIDITASTRVVDPDDQSSATSTDGSSTILRPESRWLHNQPSHRNTVSTSYADSDVQSNSTPDEFEEDDGPEQNLNQRESQYPPLTDDSGGGHFGPDVRDNCETHTSQSPQPRDRLAAAQQYRPHINASLRDPFQPQNDYQPSSTPIFCPQTGSARPSPTFSDLLKSWTAPYMPQPQGNPRSDLPPPAPPTQQSLPYPRPTLPMHPQNTLFSLPDLTHQQRQHPLFPSPPAAHIYRNPVLVRNRRRNANISPRPPPYSSRHLTRHPNTPTATPTSSTTTTTTTDTTTARPTLPTTYAGRRSATARASFPFQCAACDKKYLYLNSAQKHWSKKHSKQYGRESRIRAVAGAEKRPPLGEPRNLKSAEARRRKGMECRGMGHEEGRKDGRKGGKGETKDEDGEQEEQEVEKGREERSRGGDQDESGNGDEHEDV